MGKGSFKYKDCKWVHEKLHTCTVCIIYKCRVQTSSSYCTCAFYKGFSYTYKIVFEIHSLINYNAVGYGSLEILLPKQSPWARGVQTLCLEAGVGALRSGARDPAPRGQCSSVERGWPTGSRGPEPGRHTHSCGLVKKIASSSQKESKCCISTHLGNCFTVSGGSMLSQTGHRLDLVTGGGSHSLAFCR